MISPREGTLVTARLCEAGSEPVLLEHPAEHQVIVRAQPDLLVTANCPVRRGADQIERPDAD